MCGAFAWAICLAIGFGTILSDSTLAVQYKYANYYGVLSEFRNVEYLQKKTEVGPFQLPLNPMCSPVNIAGIVALNECNRFFWNGRK